MADQFADVSSQGFLQRILGSIVGFFIGPVLVIAAIALLSWNEGRAVQAANGLRQAGQALVEADAAAVSPANEGKLVHVTGMATATMPVLDPDLGIKFDGQVAVARKAEMYQWSEKKESKTQDKLGGGQETVTDYTYEKTWADRPIDSSSFKHPDGHTNPAMAVTAGRWAASDAKLGAYTLAPDTLGLIAPDAALTPDAPDGWRAGDGALHKGDADAPAVGDERLHYTGLASGQTITVLAAQAHGGFAPYATKNGYTVHMARAGDVPAKAMIADRKKSESTMTWILRGVGLVAMIIGFAMFLGPLSAVMAVIPLLGSIAEGAAVLAAFVVSVPLTLVVIAISWIAFRPVVGIGLLALAAALLFGLQRLHAGRHPTGATATA